MSNNNGLYFLVGGLLVAVIVIGALFLTKTDEGQEITKKTNTVIERTVDDVQKDDTGSSLELNVDENGFRASSETTEEKE